MINRIRMENPPSSRKRPCPDGLVDTLSSRTVTVFTGPDLGNIHGLNEHLLVKSLLEGRAFLYDLIRIYADEK